MEIQVNRKEEPKETCKRGSWEDYAEGETFQCGGLTLLRTSEGFIDLSDGTTWARNDGLETSFRSGCYPVTDIESITIKVKNFKG